MNKKICSMAALFTVFSCFLNVNAASIDRLDIRQDMAGDTALAQISVSGKSDKSYVTLYVVNPGKEEVEVNPNDSQSVMSTYQILKNIKVSKDGTYEYNYNVINGEGQYLMKVDDKEKTFFLLSYDEMQNFIDALNGSNDAGETAALFEDIDEELGIGDLTGYKFSREKLGSAILKKVPFKNVSEATESFRINASALILSDKGNIDYFVRLADIYEQDLDLRSIRAYEIYDDFDESERNELFSHISECGVSDYESFRKAFAEQVIFTAIANAQSYGEVSSVLNEYNDIININWQEKLKDVKEESEIYKGLRGNYYASEEELLKAVDNIIQQQKSEDNSNRHNGSGGSKSGGVPGGAADKRTPVTQITPAEENQEKTKLFKDLDSVPWAEEIINRLAEKKVLSGVGDGIFAPNDFVTREQFVQGLVSALNITGGENPEFADVEKDKWFYESICIAYKNGITAGVDENNFGIGRILTREEMAAMLQRAMNSRGYKFAGAGKSEFTDASQISDYAKETADIMFSEGIISGFPDGSFKPKGLCTRAQMAVVLDKAMQKLL